MGTFNWYEHLIVPIGEQLQKDPRFRHVKIFYDRTPDRFVPPDQCPAINYFLEGPWSDDSRGTGATSLKVRMAKVRLGFGVWANHNDPKILDKQLFGLSSDLFDFFYERQNFDAVRGILISGDIPWDIDYNGLENSMHGSQRLLVNFESVTAP